MFDLRFLVFVLCICTHWLVLVCSVFVNCYSHGLEHCIPHDHVLEQEVRWFKGLTSENQVGSKMFDTIRANAAPIAMDQGKT